MSRIKIAEEFSIPKTGQAENNEDGYLITDSFVAVVDGATSKTGITTDGKTGGRIVKDIILDTICAFSPDISCEEAVATIQAGILQNAGEETIGHAAASAVIYSDLRHEIWSIGDCRFRINDNIYIPEKKIDVMLSEMRGFAIKALLKKGYSESDLIENDLAREMIHPFLLIQSSFENDDSEYGYCVFNNSTPVDAFPYSMVDIVKIEDDAMIVLASDGYPILRGSFDESEDALQKLIKEDPLCYTSNPGTKGKSINNSSFDDRTYVRFQIVRE